MFIPQLTDYIFILFAIISFVSYSSRLVFFRADKYFLFLGSITELVLKSSSNVNIILLHFPPSFDVQFHSSTPRCTCTFYNHASDLNSYGTRTTLIFLETTSGSHFEMSNGHFVSHHILYLIIFPLLILNKILNLYHDCCSVTLNTRNKTGLCRYKEAPRSNLWFAVIW